MLNERRSSRITASSSLICGDPLRAAFRHIHLQTKAGQQTTVGGVIVEMPKNAEDSVRIQHEEIPNYMPAMVMPFAIKERALPNGLKVGDAITFECVVTDAGLPNAGNP